MLWVVLVTMVVTILRLTITPTTAVVCFRCEFYSVVILYIPNSTVLLIVPVTASAVVSIIGLTPHHSYHCHGFTL
jgi:hypothetical protein